MTPFLFSLTIASAWTACILLAFSIKHSSEDGWYIEYSPALWIGIIFGGLSIAVPLVEKLI